MTDAKQKLSQEEQKILDDRLYKAATQGDTGMVRTLLADGANVHAWEDYALRLAAENGHTETVKALLACDADVHALEDYAVRWAAYFAHTETVQVLLAAGADVSARGYRALCWAAGEGRMEMVRVLTKHIFSADSWRGKSRTDIETLADTIYGKLEAYASPHIAPEYLRETGHILIDCAIRCWEQVRPAPPKLRIGLNPAQPRPL
jgi:hypothetical protein